MLRKCKKAYAWGANKTQIPINPLFNDDTSKFDSNLYNYYVKGRSLPIRDLRLDFDATKPKQHHPMWGSIEKRNLFLTQDNYRTSELHRENNEQFRRMKFQDLGMNLRAKNLPHRLGHLQYDKEGKLYKRERSEWHNPERLYGYRKDLNYINDGFGTPRLPGKVRNKYCRRGDCGKRDIDEKLIVHLDVGSRAVSAPSNQNQKNNKIMPNLKTFITGKNIFQRDHEQKNIHANKHNPKRPIITSMKNLNINSVTPRIPRYPANQWLNNNYHNFRNPQTYVRRMLPQRSFNEQNKKPIETMRPTYTPILRHKILKIN